MQSSDDNSDESCRWDGGRAEGVSSHISRPLSHPLMAMTLLMSRAVEEIVQLEALFIVPSLMTDAAGVRTPIHRYLDWRCIQLLLISDLK
uniref:Uncharacterized protein n=1 Tax=Wuchereria bancrofti TaxID=6293 RepID=A0A1I8ECR7_WUCBA